METTRNDRHWHRVYEELPEKIRAAVDAAFEAARDRLRIEGQPTANDDRAEHAVAALTRYVVDCQEGPKEELDIRALLAIGIRFREALDTLEAKIEAKINAEVGAFDEVWNDGAEGGVEEAVKTLESLAEHDN